MRFFSTINKPLWAKYMMVITVMVITGAIAWWHFTKEIKAIDKEIKTVTQKETR